MALLEPGDVVAVDALTYPGFKLAAEFSRLELAPVPAAGDGMDLDAVADLCRRRPVRAVQHRAPAWTDADRRWRVCLPGRRRPASVGGVRARSHRLCVEPV
ncbi:hypothetical protein G6F24_016445 [Rhizopus arrhizus]|nr:hypothetical protein G6F24_016445 [Rhizopus arrhizus]